MNPDLLLTPRQFCDKFGACADGRAFALKHKTMHAVWDKCPNPQWMLWICARLNIELEPRAARLFACWCVRNTPLTDGRTTWDLLTDERSRNAVAVAERFANGQATDAELAAAWTAAWTAAGDAAWTAAGDAAWAAVRDAAGDATGDAARAAAWTAAWTATGDAARAAAWTAAWTAAGDAQAQQLRRTMPNPFPAPKQKAKQ